MAVALLDRYIAAILSHRWLVVVLATFAMLAMTAGARFIGVTNDHRTLFDENNPQLATQDLLLYNLSLPFGSALNDRIDVAKSATRMTVLAHDPLSSGHQRAPDARAQAWLRANVPQLATEATGISMIAAHLSQRNINSMLSGMSAASQTVLFSGSTIVLALIGLLIALPWHGFGLTCRLSASNYICRGCKYAVGGLVMTTGKRVVIVGCGC